MMNRILTRVNAWCTRASAGILLLVLMMVLYEVLARSVFKRAETWSFELTSYSLLFVVFLAAARTLEQEQHARIDLFIAFLSPRAKLLVEVVVRALGLLFVALLLWATSRETLKAFQGGFVSPSKHAIPLTYVYWIMPAGTVLLLLVTLVKLRAAISRWRNS